MRNENIQCVCNCESLNIKLRPFARDESLGFIEHVLNVLDEDRFGRRGTMRLTGDADDLPEWMTGPVNDTPEHLYDLTERLRIHTLDLHPSHLQRARGPETIAARSRSALVPGPSPASEAWTRFTFSLPIPLARGSPPAQIGSCPRTHPQHANLH